MSRSTPGRVSASHRLDSALKKVSACKTRKHHPYKPNMELLEDRIVPTTVRGLAFQDVDHNGVFDGADVTVANVPVELHDAGADGIIGGGDDVLLDQTATAAGGTYQFGDVDQANVYVQFLAPAGQHFTLQDVGNDDTVDSDAQRLTGQTDLIDASVADVNNVDVGLLDNAAQATLLDKLYDLHTDGDDRFNSFGRREKWLLGTINSFGNPWYIITPGGDFAEWDGTPRRVSGKLLAKNMAAFHNDVSLLYNAYSPVLNPADVDAASHLYTVGSDFLDYGGMDEKWLRGASNRLGNHWYFITPNSELYEWDGTPRQASGTLLGHFNVSVYDDPSLLYDGAVVPTDPFVLDEQLTLYFTGNDWRDWGGLGERWVAGDPNAFGQHWYFIQSDGSFWEWDGTRGRTVGNKIGQFTLGEYNNLPGLHSAFQPPPTAAALVRAAELHAERNFSDPVDRWLNWGNEGDIWLLGTPHGGGNPWYILKPNGDLLEWDGNRNHQPKGNLLASLGTAFYNDPSLLQGLGRIPAVTSISPTNGERLVNVTRETIVRFNDRIDPTTVTTDSFYLIAQGERIPGRVVVSSTGLFATFFYDDPLPASTEVRVVVEGDQIRTLGGLPVDANRDGVLGGKGTSDFRTLPLSRIPGTNVFGFVRDSATGNQIEGATIRVDAFPAANVVTDANGRFELMNMPAPEFFVHVDGSTAANIPAGFAYPSVGKPFHSVPGRTVQLSMNGTPFDIFLPLFSTGDIQPLSDTVATQVGFGPGGLDDVQAMFPALDPALFEALKVGFAPGAAIDEFGTAATEAFIIPVAPNRIPAPLPENLNPQLVISIQAVGATNFDVPAPITFPNLDNLPPGEKSVIWSFDHDAGEFAPIGLGTVSADGSLITSDPGVGILAPGWHFVSPPLNWTGNGGEPEGNMPVTQETPPQIEAKLFATGDTDSLMFRFTPPPGPGDQIGDHELPAGEMQPKRVVEITVMQQANFENFYDNSGAEGLKTETITLQPGDQPVTRRANLRTLQDVLNRVNGGNALDHDRIYGAKITVKETLTLADGSRFRSSRIVLPYLIVDQSDDNGTDQNLKMADTVITGTTKFRRRIDLRTFGAPIPTFVFDGATAGDFDDDIDGFVFDPSAAGDRTTRMQVQIEVEGQSVRSSHGVQVTAKGTDKQRLNVNTSDLKATLDSINVQGQITVKFTAATASNTYQLTFDGATTGNIRRDANAATIAAALTGLATISGGDVSVVQAYSKTSAGTTTRVFHVDFMAGLDGTAKTLTGAGTGGSVSMSVTRAEWLRFDTDAERTTIANDTLARLRDVLFTGESDGFDVADSAGTNTITVDWQRIDRYGALGTSAPDGIDKAADILTTLNTHKMKTDVVQNYFLDQAVNQSLSTTVIVYVDTPVEIRNITAEADPDKALVNTLAKTAAHEAGHSLGARHTHKKVGGVVREVTVSGVQGRTDLMLSGIDLAGALAFRERLTANILDLALNLGWTEQQAQRAWDVYVEHYNQLASGFDSFDPGPDDPDGIEPVEEPDDTVPFTGSVLLVLDPDNGLLGTNRDFGSVLVDGIGNEAATANLQFVSAGDEDLTITNITLDDPGGVFDITNVAPGTVLLPGERLNFDVTFDPTSAGTHTAELTVETSDDVAPSFTVDLTGFGLDPNPVFTVTIGGDMNPGNNNFGGVTVGQQSAPADFLVVTNQGALDLIFTPTLTSGDADYDLNGFAGVERTLATGEELVLPLAFQPTTTGLRPGRVHFATNDPNQPAFDQAVIGTGIPNGGIGMGDYDWGNDYAVVEYDGFTQRTITNDVGDFMFDVPVFTEYQISIFDPESGYIAGGRGTSGPAGAFTDLTTGLTFQASTTPDGDGDGLPSDIENAIGTSRTLADTDNDALNDGVEVRDGLNPLDGIAFPTGVVANLALPGTSEAVAVVGDLVYVATGSHGLAILDGASFDQPILLGQINLPGTATDVAVDSNSAIAAVAVGSTLELVDVTDPMLPVLSRTIPHAASLVEVVNGVGYAFAGNILREVDVLTGEVLQTLVLPVTGTPTGLARDGNLLYAYLSGSDTLLAIDISKQGEAEVVGQLNVSVASSNVGLFVGNDEAWLAGSGLRSVAVSDPANPTLISGADTFFSARRVALNGSGLALVTPDGGAELEIYDVSDPAETDELLVEFTLSSAARDVAVSRGFAYVATNDGIEVVNYLAFDTNGVPPTVSISTPVEDADPNTGGLQVLEGTSVPVRVEVTDDVQVRNVDLLVNGQVVNNDVAFPFDFVVPAPSINGTNEFTIQTRATDTGGNSALTDVLTIGLVPDLTPPTIESINPVDGATRFTGHRTMRVRFSEPIAEASATGNNFRVVSGGPNETLGDADDVLIAANLQLRDDDHLVQLTTNPLQPNAYQLQIVQDNVTDRKGNQLGTGLFTSNFEVQDFGASAEFLPFGSDITIRQDDQSFPVAPLPFAFEFFGQPVSGNMFVTTNGIVEFDADTVRGEFINFGLPNAQRTLAAPFFDDLDPRIGTDPRIGLFDGEGVRAISFFDIPYFRDVRFFVSFQIAFLSNGVIQMRYGDMAQMADGSATIGLARGDQAAVPSLGNIVNKLEVAITDVGGFLNADGLTVLDQNVGANDMLVFTPNSTGGYDIAHNPGQS